jgi:hypothetical protein
MRKHFRKYHALDARIENQRKKRAYHSYQRWYRIRYVYQSGRYGSIESSDILQAIERFHSKYTATVHGHDLAVFLYNLGISSKKQKPSLWDLAVKKKIYWDSHFQTVPGLLCNNFDFDWIRTSKSLHGMKLFAQILKWHKRNGFKDTSKTYLKSNNFGWACLSNSFPSVHVDL